jgi:hypothetical protein
MQANETAQSNTPATATGLEPIASMRHFIGLLLIGAGVVALGFLAQHQPATNAPNGQLAGHAVAIKVYLFAIALDWALFYYCWAGVHRRGGSLWSLAGGRWNSWAVLPSTLRSLCPSGLYGKAQLTQSTTCLAPAARSPSTASCRRAFSKFSSGLQPAPPPESARRWSSAATSSGSFEHLQEALSPQSWHRASSSASFMRIRDGRMSP